MLKYLLSLPRPVKRIITLAIDVVLLLCAFWFAFWVRIDSMTPVASLPHWILILSVIIVTLGFFVKLGLYRAVIRYITAKILVAVAFGMVASSLLLIIAAFYANLYLPRTVPIIYFSFGLLMIAGTRLALRMIINRGLKMGTKIIIYGAGASGRQLLPALSQASEYYPVAFVDDNPRLQGTVMHGVAVYSPKKLAWLVDKYDVKKILLAMPSASRSRKVKLSSNWKVCHVRCYLSLAWLIWWRVKSVLIHFVKSPSPICWAGIRSMLFQSLLQGIFVINP